jgi:hypothetical protein
MAELPPGGVAAAIEMPQRRAHRALVQHGCDDPGAGVPRRPQVLEAALAT